MDLNIRFDQYLERESLSDPKQYQRLIGKLISLIVTQYISLLCRCISRYMYEFHWIVVCCILRYLKGLVINCYITIFFSVGYHGLFTWWLGDPLDSCIIFVGVVLVMWRSNKQSVIAHSSVEALTHTACELVLSYYPFCEMSLMQ